MGPAGIFAALRALELGINRLFMNEEKMYDLEA